MLTAAVSGLLVALLVAACTGRFFTVQHRPAPHAQVSRREATRIDHASFLDALSRRVRTGSSLSAALVDESPCHGELALVAASVEAGSALVDALRAVGPRDADQALALQALSAAAQIGGPVAATLDGAAAVLRERAAARAERRAHSAQARLSARVLTVVPLAFAVWNFASNAPTRHLYATSVAALTCAVAGIVLNLSGWLWMLRIVGPP